MKQTLLSSLCTEILKNLRGFVGWNKTRYKNGHFKFEKMQFIQIENISTCVLYLGINK